MMRKVDNRSTDLMSSKKAVLIYIAVSLFLAFEMAIQVSPSVMASELMHGLSMSSFSLGVMSSVYFYSYTMMQIPSGLLFDRFSAKTIIFFALLTCSIGSIIFGCITSFYLGCLARLLMGVGSAFAFVSVLVMASRLFKSKWFTVLTGVTQMLAAIGAMCGQLPIRVLINYSGWRNTMFILGAFGIGLAFIIVILLRDSDDKKPQQESEPHGDYKSIASSLKLIIANSQTWIIAIYACLLWAPMSGFASLWGVPFLESLDGLSVTSAALFCSIMWLGLALGSPLLGVLSTLIKDKVLPLKLSACIGVVSFGLVLTFHMHSAILGICLFFSGFACSGQALSFVLVKENNPQQIRGTAIAFNNMAVVISGVIFQPLIGGIITLTHSVKGLTPSTSAYKNGIAIVLFAYVLSALVALFFIKNKPARS